MRCADHDTCHQAKRTGKIGHGGRRHGPGEQDVDTRSREARLQRGFEHVARNARVLANDHGWAAMTGVTPCQHATSRIAQPQCEFGIDSGTAYPTADAVGTKIFTFAHTKDSSLIVRQIFNASTVSATSCTRSMCPPCSTPYSAAARLAASRSRGSRPTTWPSMDFREKPSSQGYSSTRIRSRYRSMV